MAQQRVLWHSGAMKHGWLLGFAFAVSVSGCALFNVGNSGSTSGGGSGTTTAGSGSGATQGVSCGADPTTGVTLCLGLSTCSGVTVDSEVFPGCGFRVSGSNIDLECVCGSYLCPIGAAASCSAASSLLAGTNEGNVCAQASGGGCVELGTVSTSAASSGGSSTCDEGCAGDCANDPVCLEACGC